MSRVELQYSLSLGLCVVPHRLLSIFVSFFFPPPALAVLIAVAFIVAIAAHGVRA